MNIKDYKFHDWLKSLPFIVFGWDPWIKKGDKYLSSIEGIGGLKDIHCIAQNAALFADLLKNIFWTIWLHHIYVAKKAIYILIKNKKNLERILYLL